MSISVSDKLVPGGPAFGIINDSDQVGGWAVETSETTIGAINTGRLKIGGQRYSLASGITYQLTSLTPAGGFANGTWTPVTVPNSGGSWSPGADTVATTNISLVTEQSINGVTTLNSRVLVVGQTAPATNGLYTSNSSSWVRTSDANIAADFVIGKSIPVLGGSFAGTIYICNQVPTALNTDPIGFISNTTGSSVAVGKDLSGTTTLATVVALQGVTISTTTPTSAQVLQYNSTTTRWTPTTIPSSTTTGTGLWYNVSGTLNAAAVTLSGDITPGALSGSNLPITVGAIQGQTVTSGALIKGNLLIATTTSNWASTTLTGDVALSVSTPGASTVIAIQGTGVSTSTPTSGQVLTFNSGTSKWTPAAPTMTSVTGTGIWYSASGTLNSAAISLSGDATAGALSGSNLPITVGAIQGQTVTSGALTKGNLFIATTTSNWAQTAVTGDVSFSAVTPGLTTVTAIQGFGIATSTPTSNQVLTYNSGTSKWTAATPATPGVTGTGLFYAAGGVTNAAAVTLSGDVTPSTLSGSNLPVTVVSVNGTTVPAGGSLTTGNSLHVTGASALGYAALNLAGGSGFVSGLLPTANQSAQTMGGDVTGTTAASVVAKVNGVSVTGTPSSGQIIIATSGTAATWQTIPVQFTAGTDLSGTATSQTVIQIHGTTVPAGGSLTTGNQLIVTGASALGYAALNLAGGSGFVSGQLPVANLANGTAGQVLITNSGATAPAWVSLSGDVSVTAAGATDVISISGPSGGGGTIPLTFLESDWSPVTALTVKTFAATLQTTNATTTTIVTLTTATSKSYVVQAQLSTTLNGANDWLANSYTCYFENAAGTTTIRGNVIGTAGGTTSGLAWPGLSFALSGTSVLAQVTGAASTTVTWKVALTVQVSG